MWKKKSKMEAGNDIFAWFVGHKAELNLSVLICVWMFIWVCPGVCAVWMHLRLGSVNVHSVETNVHFRINKVRLKIHPLITVYVNVIDSDYRLQPHGWPVSTLHT